MRRGFACLLLVACSGPPSPPAPPPLTTPFATVEEPRAFCGDPLEAELRARPIGIPSCDPPRTDLRYVRARAGARDVVVIVLDDSRPTAQDGDVEHHGCLVVDGALRGPRCDQYEEPTSLDAELGELRPASPADARALLRAAVLLDRRSPEVFFDVAARDARAASAGLAGDAIRSVEVEIDEHHLTAVAVTFDESYAGWSADITSYDASIDERGHVGFSTYPILEAHGSHDAREPWAPAPHEDEMTDSLLLQQLGAVTGVSVAE